MRDLKLGLQLGYWSARPPEGFVEMVQEAERLGFDSVWTAEAYGSDAITPLAYLAAQTETIRLGTGVCQLSARTPTAMAMAAMTLDHLSQGRFILGLGASRRRRSTRKRCSQTTCHWERPRPAPSASWA